MIDQARTETNGMIPAPVEQVHPETDAVPLLSPNNTTAPSTSPPQSGSTTLPPRTQDETTRPASTYSPLEVESLLLPSSTHSLSDRVRRHTISTSSSGRPCDETTPLLDQNPKLADGDGSASSCTAHLGLLYALIAEFCSSVVNALVKSLVSVEPAALSVFRFLAVLMPAAVVAGHRRSVFPAGHRWALVLRALIGTVGLITKFYAMRLMPLVDASVIVLSVPVLVAVFARIFLKEPITWVNMVTIVVTICGIVLIVQPPLLFGGTTATYSALGPVVAISSSIFTANSYVLLRQLKDVHYSATLTVYGVVAVPLSCGVWMALGDPHLPTDAVSWLMITAVSLLGFAIQLFYTKACQVELAGPVAVVSTSDILFAVVWQVALFGQVPGPYSWLGMFLVVAAVLMVAAHKWYLSRMRAVCTAPDAVPRCDITTTTQPSQTNQ